MSIKEAKAILKPHGISLRKTKVGDFRVNLRDAPESIAYYTTDINDAVEIGIAMTREPYYGE